MIKVTVFNEFSKCGHAPNTLKVYPEGLHKVIGEYLSKDAEIEVKYATMEMDERGLSEQILNDTDVLLWWGHWHHDEVEDEIVARVVERVQKGMGICFLHSGHFSKPFKRLMGTSCTLRWREADEKERVWTIMPSHPIAKNIPETFVIEKEETYGERFDIPEPDETVFMGWFQGGEVFRSGVTYRRGLGKVFYFQPGHETYPVYYQKEIRQILNNAVHWLKPELITDKICCEECKPLEKY